MVTAHESLYLFLSVYNHYAVVIISSAWTMINVSKRRIWNLIYGVVCIVYLTQYTYYIYEQWSYAMHVHLCVSGVKRVFVCVHIVFYTFPTFFALSQNVWYCEVLSHFFFFSCSLKLPNYSSVYKVDHVLYKFLCHLITWIQIIILFHYIMIIFIISCWLDGCIHVCKL